jgi:hypothetical protein
MTQVALYQGFPVSKDGSVEGELPPDVKSRFPSDPDNIDNYDLVQAGYEVVILCIDEDSDFPIDDEEDRNEEGEIYLDVALQWCPEPPPGEGWKLAWKTPHGDDWNVVWWRKKNDS